MIPFKVVTKVEQDVRPEIVTHIAEEFLEYLGRQGWDTSWARTGPEPKAGDGGEMGYREMAEMWVLSLKEREV